MDDLPQSVKACNDTVHSTKSMAHSRVTDSGVLAIWKRMDARREAGVRIAKATFCVGKHLRISKEKMEFTKAAKQNLITEIFRGAKVIDRRTQAV